MIFTLTAADFRASVYRDLTGVQEVVMGGAPTIFAACPHCRSTIVRQPVGATGQSHARTIFEAHAHVAACMPPGGR